MDQTLTDDVQVDERRLKRIRRFEAMFAFAFGKDTFDPEFKSYITQFQEKQTDIDQMIAEAAPEWPIDQMNRVDLSILRVFLYEFLTKKTPKKVLVNEAIEIAKLYGTENSPKFVNGVLGKLVIDSTE